MYSSVIGFKFTHLRTTYLFPLEPPTKLVHPVGDCFRGLVRLMRVAPRGLSLPSTCLSRKQTAIHRQHGKEEANMDKELHKLLSLAP